MSTVIKTNKTQSMKNNIMRWLYVVVCIVGAAFFAACSEDAEPQHKDAKSMPMTFTVKHPSQTRATETDFEKGDRIGLYVADANKQMEIGGNLVNNEVLTYDGNVCTSVRPLYWDDGTFNVYAFYPRMDNVVSLDYQPFSVALDQNTPRTATALGGYEASDLLFASQKNVTASDSPVALYFRHIMSKLRIRLVKGEDFEGELPTKVKVYVHSTITSAVVAIREGIVSYDPGYGRQSIIAHQDDATSYSAIIVPQNISTRMPFLEVEINGVSYFYESQFWYKSGVEHLVNLIISKDPEQVKIEIGGEIKDWQ